MSIFKYTCAGGPLDGITFGPFPAKKGAAKLGAGIDATLVSKLLLSESTLCTAKRYHGRRLVTAQGLYNIVENGDGYSATHIPSEQDIDFPPVPAPQEAPVDGPDQH